MLVGCDSDQKPAHTATLLDNHQVQAALQELNSSIDELQAAIGRFNDENWRDVVPDVESASSSVSSAFSSLQTALGVRQ